GAVRTAQQRLYLQVARQLVIHRDGRGPGYSQLAQTVGNERIRRHAAAAQVEEIGVVCLPVLADGYAADIADDGYREGRILRVEYQLTADVNAFCGQPLRQPGRARVRAQPLCTADADVERVRGDDRGAAAHHEL